MPTKTGETESAPYLAVSNKRRAKWAVAAVVLTVLLSILRWAALECTRHRFVTIERSLELGIIAMKLALLVVLAVLAVWVPRLKVTKTGHFRLPVGRSASFRESALNAVSAAWGLQGHGLTRWPMSSSPPS